VLRQQENKKEKEKGESFIDSTFPFPPFRFLRSSVFTFFVYERQQGVGKKVTQGGVRLVGLKASPFSLLAF